MTKTDYHMHTAFCDGKNTAEEMVCAAIEAGLTRIGFSGHSHTPFDESYCMSVENTAAYREEIARLKEKYRGRIEILCGVEQDYYSDMPTDGYDYVIGSVHYLKFGDDYIPVDEGNQNLRRAAEQYCGGDILSVCERYYETVAGVEEKTDCEIIGHFDLISKYNEAEQIFNEHSARYVAAWQAAADRLLRSDALFEPNTGAISRGCRKKPYPSEDILAYLAAHNARVIRSSDSHSANTICFGFSELDGLINKFGLTLAEPVFR